MSVVNLEEEREARRPHLQGRARCLSCRHEWQQVAPIGETEFECPKCTLMMGRLVYECIREGLHFTCNCGNDLFFIAPEGPYCPKCGAWCTGY